MLPRNSPSATTRRVLLPATVNASREADATHHSFLSWTFGRNTVLWRIWPAVALHTVFAAVVVYVSLETEIHLAIPNVMLTLLGVVIGFVISYRASSGYDRYWQGRSYWSEVIRSARTISRLIWVHVPLHFGDVNTEEVEQRVLGEKEMALDLVEGYVVALKHHLRGEMGIHYEDLYPLVAPLHGHPHHLPKRGPVSQNGTQEDNHHLIAPQEHAGTKSSFAAPIQNPVIPPINAYGTFKNPAPSTSSLARSLPGSASSSPTPKHPLLPSSVADARRAESGTVSGDLIPFTPLFASFAAFVRRVFRVSRAGERDVEGGHRRWGHHKHRPRVAGGGENLPLEIIGCLSIWVSVLEARGVGGSAIGGILGCLAAFEDSLAALERILTTPLPFVYSVHISTVWVYLFALPFQLVNQFRWHTVPGVCLASFIYLGFLAAGEEIEQPFGYDENDLDLDLFCREVVKVNIERIKRTPCPNALPGFKADLADDAVEDVFGKYVR